jgi:hypothetical protein
MSQAQCTVEAKKFILCNQCVGFQLFHKTLYCGKSLIKTQFRHEYPQYSDITFKEGIKPGAELDF